MKKGKNCCAKYQFTQQVESHWHLNFCILQQFMADHLSRNTLMVIDIPFQDHWYSMLFMFIWCISIKAEQGVSGVQHYLDWTRTFLCITWKEASLEAKYETAIIYLHHTVHDAYLKRKPKAPLVTLPNQQILKRFIQLKFKIIKQFI